MSVVSETLFGNVDIKTKSVHFYVQRSADFALSDVIPFDIVQLNEGGAMNPPAGIFTVPVDGIYQFEVSALRDAVSATDAVYIDFQVNGVTIASSYATNLPDFVALYGINVSFRLKTGDQVRLYKLGGVINDNNRHYTHFSGRLVEEDLVLVGNN